MAIALVRTDAYLTSKPGSAAMVVRNVNICLSGGNGRQIGRHCEQKRVVYSEGRARRRNARGRRASSSRQITVIFLRGGDRTGVQSRSCCGRILEND